ncbi:MAG: DUF177 domain-containing protein [Gemmatimonadota bacterium]
MFRLDLRALDRVGRVSVEGVLEPDHPLWAGVHFALAEPLEVSFTATPGGQDQVMVQGRLRGKMAGECRRCLEPTTSEFDLGVDWYFIPPDELSEEGEDSEVRFLDPTALELDLEPLIREEMVLSVPRFQECRTDCRGLCPRCGTNLNLESCECREDTEDPRWDVLRALPTD